MPSVCVVTSADIGGEHDEIAVRDIDEPHDAEDQRQPGGEHGVEPADQHALEDDVDPLHHAPPPGGRVGVTHPEIRRGDLLAGQILGRAGERDAALLQAIDALRRLERLHDVLLDQHDRSCLRARIAGSRA